MFYENLPEALLFFPSLATDRLLALLGVGEGGLDKAVKIISERERLFKDRPGSAQTGTRYGVNRGFHQIGFNLQDA